MFSVSACADKSAIRDKERERYDALESELISAQETEERRRRSEFRVAQKLQQLDSERTANALARMQSTSETLLTNEKHSVAEDADPVVISMTGPVVTNIFVGQPAVNGSKTWSLQDYPSPVDGSALCAVVSVPVMVSNGTLETRVSVVVGKTAVFLRTDATFDTTVPEIGYRIDMGIPIAFDHFLNELTAVVDDGYDRLLSAMSGGATLKVSFAYSPQISSAETHVIELPLDSIEQSLSDLTGCGK